MSSFIILSDYGHLTHYTNTVYTHSTRYPETKKRISVKSPISGLELRQNTPRHPYI